MLCLTARFRDTHLAEQSLSRLVNDLSPESGLDLHPHDAWPGGAIFQIDGNLGAIADIAELLLHSHRGALAFLPCHPPSWPAGHVRGLRARGGLSVDLSWDDSTLQRASIHTTQPRRIVVESDQPPLVCTDIGEVLAVEADDPGRWAWQAKADSTYDLSPA